MASGNFRVTVRRSCLPPTLRPCRRFHATGIIVSGRYFSSSSRICVKAGQHPQNASATVSQASDDTDQACLTVRLTQSSEYLFLYYAKFYFVELRCM